MPAERSGPAVSDSSGNTGGKGEMIKAPDNLQDLRRKIYAKAKAEPHWRFWGLYVHVCKMETLRAAYAMAKSNDGAPGSDGVTFEAIEEQGVDGFLEQLGGELIERRYMPLRARKKEIPKEGSTKVRTLSIPCIRDRVVQGALKLIVEPIFEADFQPGSFGYRPKRSAQQAVIRVADAIAMGKTRVIDLDLRPILTVFGTMCCSPRWPDGSAITTSCACSRSCSRRTGNGAFHEAVSSRPFSVISTSTRWIKCWSGHGSARALASTRRSSTRGSRTTSSS